MVIKVDTYIKCPKCSKIFEIRSCANVNAHTENAEEIKCKCGFRMEIKSHIEATILEGE